VPIVNRASVMPAAAGLRSVIVVRYQLLILLLARYPNKLKLLSRLVSGSCLVSSTKYLPSPGLP
jgi:hypothetical protein